MVFEDRGGTLRLLDRWEFQTALLFSLLDPPFHVSDSFGVLLHLDLVTRS